MFISYVLCYESSIVIKFIICVTSIVPITTFFTLLFIPLGSAPLSERTRTTFKTPFLHCHVLTLSLSLKRAWKRAGSLVQSAHL